MSGLFEKVKRDVHFAECLLTAECSALIPFGTTNQL